MGTLGKYLLRTALLLAMASPVHAGFSALLKGSVAEFVAGGPSGTLTLTFDPPTGRLRHNRYSAGDPGFASDFDFDTTRLGVQSLRPGDAVVIRVTTADAAANLVADDSIASLAGVCAIVDHAVKGVFGGVRIEYDQLQRVELRCGASSDIVVVESTAGIGADLVVDAGAGDDVVVLADTGNTLDSLTAPIAVRGGTGRDGLTLVDERIGGESIAYAIDRAAISRTRGGVTLAVNLTGDDFEDIRLLAGAGSDAVFIDSLPLSADSVAIECGAGDDTVTIADAAGTVHGITSPLAIDGGAGTNQLLIVDSGESVTKTLTVSSTRVGLGVNDTFFRPGGWLEYSNIANLEVRLGAGKDDLHVSPSASAAIRFLDSSLDPGPLLDGDRIDLINGGTTGEVISSPAPGHLRYTFADRQDVDFVGFERMRPGGAIRGTVFLDRNRDGIRQPDEPPQAFAAVSLSIAGFPATAWARVADADGTFSFEDLVPADYRVAALPIGDLRPSTPAAEIPIAIEEVVTDVPLGLSVATGGTVSGLVFNDLNFSGSLDGGESGLGLAVVFADLNGDRVLNANEPRIVTPPDGSFTLEFTADTAGTLLPIGPTGFVATTPGAPFDVRTGGAITGVRLGLAAQPTPPGGGTPPDGTGGGSGGGDGSNGGTMPPGDGGGGSEDGSSDSSGSGGAADGSGGQSGSSDAGDLPPDQSEDPSGTGLDNPDAIARRCAACGNLGLLGWMSMLIPLSAMRIIKRRRLFPLPIHPRKPLSEQR